MTKLFGFTCGKAHPDVKLSQPFEASHRNQDNVQVSFNPSEDPEETYLYAEDETAISSMAVLPLHRNQLETKEVEMSEIEQSTQVSSGDLLVMSLRNSANLYLHF